MTDEGLSPAVHSVEVTKADDSEICQCDVGNDVTVVTLSATGDSEADLAYPALSADNPFVILLAAAIRRRRLIQAG